MNHPCCEPARPDWIAEPLPIDDVLEALEAALESHGQAVLIAPPGAGKTTRVPLVLLEQAWAQAGKHILLEPRRLAARAAAERMAAMLGERVGETIGLRVRMQSIVSRRTRLEIVTEGVFARMIIDDPSLDGIAGVLFDEFHERSLDADLGLALALDAKAGLRPELRLLVMSATLDGARVAALLGDAPVIRSEGRAHPVETRYVRRDPRRSLEEDVARLVMEALAAEPGSILVFLPGQREIARVNELLRERISNGSIDIAPLFGAMERKAQDLALRPPPEGRRKIVLATSIAETSLTIEGVRIVIDSGFARVPRYEPGIGLTRLETVRVSKAAADQRRGRAGRTEPGVCYRLWEEAATRSLEPFATPEILSADLSGLLLDLAAWGVRDPRQLSWLDPPPRPAIQEASALLADLDALDADGMITPQGRALRALALPPRLARMVLAAARAGQAEEAADVAAVLVERGAGGDAIDLAERVERLNRDRSPRAADARRLARSFAKQAKRALTSLKPTDDAGAPGPAGGEPLAIGRMVALAYPERIAKARGKPGEFLLANGRAASVEPHLHLAREPYLAVAELAGSAAAARILAAAAIADDDIEAVGGPRIEARDELVFDRASAALRARRIRRLGALVLTEQPLAAPAMQDAAEILAKGLAEIGIERLPWTSAQRQWRDRVAFLRALEPSAEQNPWPDLSDTALARTAEQWLAPFILGKTRLSEITPDALDTALRSQLPRQLARRLDAEAPATFEAPTGSRVAIDYSRARGADQGPVVSIRVQEVYGLTRHPAIAGGRVPLVLELLSPAHRPIQITRDLPGFWRGSWAQVKSELKGRYPRHFWPDDPASAAPTSRAKPKGT